MYATGVQRQICGTIAIYKAPDTQSLFLSLTRDSILMSFFFFIRHSRDITLINLTRNLNFQENIDNFVNIFFFFLNAIVFVKRYSPEFKDLRSFRLLCYILGPSFNTNYLFGVHTLKFTSILLNTFKATYFEPLNSILLLNGYPQLYTYNHIIQIPPKHIQSSFLTWTS